MQSIGQEPASFVEDGFTVARFWYEKRNKFPILHQVALRVLATPVSSASSERVFSSLKKLVTSDRSRLSAKNIEDILVARSLLSKNF